MGTTWIESQSFTKILKRKIEYMETHILEWKIWILYRCLFFRNQYIDLIKYKILKEFGKCYQNNCKCTQTNKIGKNCLDIFGKRTILSTHSPHIITEYNNSVWHWHRIICKAGEVEQMAKTDPII